MAHRKTWPRRSIRCSVFTIQQLAATAPSEGAAYSQPKPAGPTCSTSVAKSGISAVADEKKAALKSSSIVERTSGVRSTKRTPSTAAAQVAGALVLGSRAGRSRIAHRLQITGRNESALIVYSQPTSSQTSATPAIEGPITEASWKSVVFRLIAFERCARGTSIGTSEERAGVSIDEAAAVRAVST